jgi:LysM repeat protein
MAKKRGDIYLLAALLLLFLVIDIGQATWLLTPPLTRKYVVQPGQTLADVANRHHVSEGAILQANGLRPGAPVEAGQILAIPLPALAPLRERSVQWVGLAGTVLGVLISFWLTSVTALLPKDSRPRIFCISLGLALISYVTVQVSSSEVPAIITPLFVFNAIKDGFAWSTSVPLLAKALGFGTASDYRS